MEFRAFEPGIEVNGQTVWSIVDGFMLSKQTPSRILVEEGIGTIGPGGVVKIDADAWYSQEACSSTSASAFPRTRSSRRGSPTSNQPSSRSTSRTTSTTARRAR
jgi:hypothetical protein